MKKELYIGLVSFVLLTGCGGITGEDGESDDNSVSHYQGTSCLSCHGTGSGAEGKYFRSGVTIYSDLNSSTAIDGYTIKLLMDNSNTITYVAGRGVGNANSGLYSTTLDGYLNNKYTVQILNASGVVQNGSGTNTHDASRLDCNSCHTATGLNGAPGRVTPTVAAVVAPTNTTLSFANDVMPLLQSSCLSCHGTNGNFTITTATATYSNITALTNGGVDTTTPSNSYLLQKSTNTITHGGGAIWSTTNSSYITVKTWIEQGALNN